ILFIIIKSLLFILFVCRRESIMKLLKKLIVCILFTALLSITTTVYADQAVINTDHLNVRNGPGTAFDKIQQVHTNEVYQVIEIDGDWIEIEIGNDSGWITTEYVTIEKEVDVEVEKQTSEHVNKPVESIKNPSSITIVN